MIRVYLEVERTWAFACAVDHPGWQRRGRGEEAALEELERYRRRYGAAVGTTPKGELHVVGTLAGTTTTGFGAPDVEGPWDAEPLQAHEVGALEQSWAAFDRAVAASGAELLKGPRGGGRDRDGVADHTREAERAYARKLGVRCPPGTPWVEQRALVAEALRGESPTTWSRKYAVRRIAWHVLDHAWEIEDKQLS